MVELLIVIVVIAILVAIVAGVSSRVLNNQKVNTTKVIMRDLKAAIEEFAAKDPLRVIYNAKPNITFGPYPPYQLRDPSTNAGANENRVAGALEPFRSGSPPQPPPDLADRLNRDIGKPNAAEIRTTADSNDDLRALYTYLRMHVPQSLARVPDRYIATLPAEGAPADGEHVDVTGTHSNEHGRVQVLGVNDAWGVPFDYFMYVKVEWRFDDSLTPARARLVVTDRVPVLRSRGIDKDHYAARKANPLVEDNKKWIFSDNFPSPGANGNWLDWNSGQVTSTNPPPSGWARAVAFGETYGYYPDERQDK